MSEENTTFNLDDEILNFVEDPNASIIKVIGVGGGGCNAVNYMYDQNIPNVRYVVCNTDRQHLDMLPVPNKLLLGPDLRHGRGAGNDPAVGRQCAEASEKEIKQLFMDGTEMVFITAGMGGGTGTGAAPVVARLAKEAGMLTIGIVTVPFMFEGDKKILKALDGANEMREHVDALLLINNENLIELYPDLNFFNAFEKADETLANAARSISDIISEKAKINVDFEDVRSTLRGSGTAIISTAYGEGEHRISDAISNALHSPLLKAHDIYTSKRLLFKFTCNREAEKPIRAEEIAEITQFTSKLPSSIDVKWGIAHDANLGDKVKLTVLASGFDVTLREGSAEHGEGTERHEDEAAQRGPISFKAEGQNEQKPRQNDSEKRIEEVYGTEKVVKQRRAVARMKYAVLTPAQFDDHQVIALIESVPTFNRDPHFNEELKKLSEITAANDSNDRKDRDAGGTSISFRDFG